MAFLLLNEKLSSDFGRLSNIPSFLRYTVIEFLVNDIDLLTLTLCMRRSQNILSFSSRRCDSGIIPTRCSFVSLVESTRLYCFSQFWTIHEKNYDTVPAVSPPFRSFILLSLLNILAFSIFDSPILRSSSGLPL